MRVERALLALFLLDPDLIDNVSRHLLPEDLISLLSAIEREGNLTKKVEYMTMALVGVM